MRCEQKSASEDYVGGRSAEDWPIVTTQLPIYNESEVSERIIRAAAAMDYPTGRHQIQVLDDSTDATTRILVDGIAEALRRDGVEIQVVRRR